jgi:hypothetical protein
MTWVERNNMFLSAPYRIYRSVSGFECWHYGKSAFVLARQVPTIKRAKEICEEHKAKVPA